MPKLQTQTQGQMQGEMMTMATMSRSSLSRWHSALILLSFQPQSALALLLLLRLPAPLR